VSSSSTRRQEGGVGAVSLGNDPDALLSYRIGADDAPSVLECQLIFLVVVVVEISSIP
jgi:hypothetical protein